MIVFYMGLINSSLAVAEDRTFSVDAMIAEALSRGHNRKARAEVIQSCIDVLSRATQAGVNLFTNRQENYPAQQPIDWTCVGGLRWGTDPDSVV